ncbi:MAG: hypothetical protein R2932_30860 [Caldilineaceae bacterium]
MRFASIWSLAHGCCKLTASKLEDEFTRRGAGCEDDAIHARGVAASHLGQLDGEFRHSAVTSIGWLTGVKEQLY